MDGIDCCVCYYVRVNPHVCARAIHCLGCFDYELIDFIYLDPLSSAAWVVVAITTRSG